MTLKELDSTQNRLDRLKARAEAEAAKQKPQPKKAPKTRKAIDSL